MHAYAWDRVTVQGNTFLNCSGGVAVAAIIDTKDNDTRPPGWGEPTGGSQPVSDVAVNDNTFTGSGSHAAVRFDGYPNGGRIHNVTLTGNTVNGSASYGFQGRLLRGLVCATNLLTDMSLSAIRIDDSVGLSISANTFLETGSTGLYLIDTDDTVVSANSLREIGHNGLHIQGGERIRVLGNQVGGAVNYGMRVSTGATDFTCTGNRVVSEAVGLSITETCRQVVRHGNDLRGSGGLGDQSPDPVTDPGDLV